MKIKCVNISITILIMLIVPVLTFSQEKSSLSQLDATVIGSYAGPKVVPFWLRSNQYGSIPLEGASVSILLKATKRYNPIWNPIDSGFRNAKFDWGYALEGRANIGSNANVQLIEAHIKAKYAIFEAKLGRTKDVMGLNGDTLLSSGNFAVSGNTLGIPVLDIRIPDYYRVPIFGGLISLKGNFSYGIVGKQPVDHKVFNVPHETYEVQTFYHQKSLYGRVGKESWKLNLLGGLNHQAYYGSEKEVFGEKYALNKLESLWYVMWGKAYGPPGIPTSKLGNQLGSIDMGLTYDWNYIQLMAYRQNFYDVGAISKLANIKDGLNGMTLTNKKFNSTNKKWDWHKILVEFFYSKDQAGYPWSKTTASGDENYYNNSYYPDGWSYKGLGIGSPLIVTAQSTKEGQADNPKNFFISNRLITSHFGLSGTACKWLFTTKLTMAKHYGTFSTSEYGSSLGGKRNPPYKDQFVPVSQFSAYLQVEKEIRKQLYLGFTGAADYGKLFHNSVALQFSVRKSFWY